MEQLRGEVLTGKERRRRWSVEEKLRVVAEATQPGTSVSSVARRHGLHPNQVFIWRTQARAGELGSGSDVFVPVAVRPEPVRAGAPNEESQRSTIEVLLRNGRLLRVSETTASDVLARLAAALEQP